MMQRLQNTVRFMALACVAATALAAPLATPLAGQNGGQSTSGAAFKVIVKDLDNKTDPKNTRFGAKVADLIRKGMASMATHTPIPAKDIGVELKKLNVAPEAFDCTTARQLGMRISAPIVMCGEYEADPAGGTKVSASFFTNEETISFDVLPFTAASEADAADKIVGQFKTYVRQLTLASVCQQNVQAELWQEALDKCVEALQLNPRSTTSQYFKATALLKLNRPEEALAGYQAVLDINPINTDAMRSAGSVAAQLGKADLATKYFKDYLQLNPGDEQVTMTIANDLNKGGDPVAAAHFIEEVVKGDTTNFDMIGSIANYYMVAASNNMKVGSTDEQKAAAAGYFTNALKGYEVIQRNLAKAKLGPTSLDNLYRYMITAYLQTKQPDKALALGPIAIANDSSTAATFSVYANALATNGRQAEAIQILDRALAKDPTLKVSYQKALLFLAAGNLDEIVNYGKKASAEGSTDAQIDGLAVQLVVEGTKKSGSSQTAWFNGAKELAKSDKPVAMANFYTGKAIFEQGVGLIPKKPAVISKGNAQNALELLRRARPLIAGSGAFTEGAASRGQYLNSIDQTITYLQAIIKQ